MTKLDPVEDSKDSANAGRKISRLRRDWSGFEKYEPGPCYTLSELFRHQSIRNSSGSMRVVFMAGCAEEWPFWKDNFEKADSASDRQLARDMMEAQRITLASNNRGSYCKDQIVAMAKAQNASSGATGIELRDAFSKYVKGTEGGIARGDKPVSPFDDSMFYTDNRPSWPYSVYNRHKKPTVR